MRIVRLSAGLMLAFMCLLAVEMSPRANAEESITASAQDSDERAIRASATSFASAFNVGDAKAIAALWTEDGEYVNQAGHRYVGRDAIQKEYETFFAELPDAKMSIKVDSLKMLTPNSAVSEGTTSLGSESGPSAVSNHYLAIFVKENNQWLMSSARDVRVEVATTYDRFPDLEKLVGTWTCKRNTTEVSTTCKMIASKKFLERTFTVSENGAVTQTGVQIIGWNPMEQQITSWVFDSTGGHAFAVWTPQGKSWVAQSTGATADGTPTGATNIITVVDGNTISWKSVNRFLGNEALADSGDLVLTRNK